MYVQSRTAALIISIYTEEINRINMQEMEIEKALRVALENNQFFLHYQPIYHLKTMRIESLEALIRWIHPTMKTISPMKFIPLAEKQGLFIALANGSCKKFVNKCFYGVRL